MDRAEGASCDADALRFRLRDPDRRLAGVRLAQRVGAPPDRLDFAFDDGAGAWRLDLPRLPVWRMEYQLELRHADGHVETVCDPDNPQRVGSAFGDKSVLECPEYAAPAWLSAPGAEGTWQELSIAAPSLGADVGTRVWTPQAPADRVLVAHDGPEYDRLAALGQYCAAMIGAGRLPPHRLVLLAPGNRDDWYSANPAYAAALLTDVLPRVAAEGAVVGMGTSLGALGMLHAHRRDPGAFAGLFLQSGSFFRPRYDRHESGFGRYRRVVRFTSEVLRGRAPRHAPPAVMTCGRVEENLRNNRDMAAALRAQGYPTRLFEVPDGHNFTGWRDALDPHLTDLLSRVWSRTGDQP
jgi:enterochelin esterase-like enzyme